MKEINKFIEVVAEFKPDGNIRPVRFRVTNENEEQIVIYIKQLKFIHDERIGKNPVKRFVCMVELNGTQRLVEVIYDLFSMKWMLYKM